ncbi:MAG: glutathione S-transferase family protein [Steroidobacteraceae bacterium]
MSELILWSYDASPFTQKALLMLGIKGAQYGWVETPMLPPKADLVTLTGGYRGTPVLQSGADVYIDSQLIARELERRLPTPPLFPLGSGLELAMVKWSDAFFRSALKVALALMLPQWPEEFRRDRQYLFPDIDFETVADEAEHAKSQFRAHAALLDQQLAGSDFLGGSKPGLADVQAYPFTWLARGAFADLAAQLLEGLDALQGWEQRMATIGHGRRTSMAAAEALAVARDSRPQPAAGIDALDAALLKGSAVVEVSPDDTRRGGVRGTLVHSSPTEFAVHRVDPSIGDIVVHFPRLGYRLTPAG